MNNFLRRRRADLALTLALLHLATVLFVQSVHLCEHGFPGSAERCPALRTAAAADRNLDCPACHYLHEANGTCLAAPASAATAEPLAALAPRALSAPASRPAACYFARAPPA